jgi:hypothetical protein
MWSSVSALSQVMFHSELENCISNYNDKQNLSVVQNKCLFKQIIIYTLYETLLEWLH